MEGSGRGKESGRSEALEAALPNLISRLQELEGDLDDEEREVFKYIIESAARHTVLVEARDEEWEPRPEGMVDFDKPRSVHATLAMKREFHALPRTLGLSSDG